MKYVQRIQEPILKDFLSGEDTAGKNILLVEGARQVGKTTLVEHCLQTSAHPVISINLERDKRIRSRIDSCVEFADFGLVLREEYGFDPAKPCVIFIDECQESEKLGGFVRFMKEEWPGCPAILSGSTLTRLFRNTQRFPVGRVSRLLVTPFSFAEFLDACGREYLCEPARDPHKVSAAAHESLCNALDDYARVGGMPQVVAAFVEHGDWDKTRKEIIADYDDDLKRIFGEDAMNVVRSCLRAVSALAGMPFKNSCVIPTPNNRQNEMINRVLSRLEDWKLVLKSGQHGIDPARSYGFHPKRYLFDTGLLRELRESSIPPLRLLGSADPSIRTAFGAVLENQTAIELSRDGSMLAGWKKSSSGAEIDFIVKSGDTAFPIECKSALRIKGSHLSGLREYLRTYRLKRGFTVSPAPYQAVRGEGNTLIENIPLYSAGFIRDMVGTG